MNHKFLLRFVFITVLKFGGRIINRVRLADDTTITAETQEELQVVVNRLVDTGRKYDMEINIYRRNESLLIKVGNKELKKLIVLNTLAVFYRKMLIVQRKLGP